jgi:hypothetical protein
MSRLSYFGSLLAASVLSASISAQTSASHGATKSAPGTARVEHVVVRETGGALAVEIQTSGAAVAPDTQSITGPDRIVVDFPGALPAAELRALKVNRGALKGIRAGLFFENPPITRVVLDLSEPQSYRISTVDNRILVRLGAANPGSASPNSASVGSVAPGTAKQVSAKAESKPVAVAVVTRPVVAQPVVARSVVAQPMAPVLVPAPEAAERARTPRVPSQPDAAPAAAPAKIQNIVLDPDLRGVGDPTLPQNRVVTTPVPAADSSMPALADAAPAKPPVTVTFANGMLCIRADRATMSQVLFEVQRMTQAEIAIPAGAEQEQVVADLGPAPARDVLASLLNGSPYNFIFVGNELSLERVILTRRDPNSF